jgi:hypothetical protein
MLFGETNHIELNGETYQGFKAVIDYPEKTAIVRLPLADETTAFLKDFRYAIPRKEQDRHRERALKLFKDIRLDKGGEEFDEYEAQMIVINMLFCDLKSAKREGNEHTFVLTTPYGDVTHVVRTPSVKERAIFSGTFDRTSDMPYITLYDQISIRVEGYIAAFTISDVPCHHKTAVVDALMLEVGNINPLKIDTNPKN